MSSQGSLNPAYWPKKSFACEGCESEAAEGWIGLHRYCEKCWAVKVVNVCGRDRQPDDPGPRRLAPSDPFADHPARVAARQAEDARRKNFVRAVVLSFCVGALLTLVAGAEWEPRAWLNVFRLVCIAAGLAIFFGAARQMWRQRPVIASKNPFGDPRRGV